MAVRSHLFFAELLLEGFGRDFSGTSRPSTSLSPKPTVDHPPTPHFTEGKLRHGVSHAARITHQCSKRWTRVVTRGLAPKHKKPMASLLDVSKEVMKQPTLPHPWALPTSSGPMATKLPSPPPEHSPHGALWPLIQGVARTQGAGALRAAPSSASSPPCGKAGLWTTRTSSLYDLRSDHVREKYYLKKKIMIK